MASEEHESAARRLKAALIEQDRLGERFDAARGTSTEPGALARLEAAGNQVTAREAWVHWVDDKSCRGLNAGPFELLAQSRDDRRPAKEEGPDMAEACLGEGDQTLSERARQSSEDGQGARRRDRTAQERDAFAQGRDELSMLRDEVAEGHDQEAADLDLKDDLYDRHTLRVEELRAHGRTSRRRAGDDRERGSRDRQAAAHDRERAARDREESACDRRHSGTDGLTGARRRGVGLEELDNEMKRARRTGTSLVAAYVDIDGLKAVNDTQGHAAGDEVLRTVVDGLRRHMRSYDLLVRLGGDEFLCALPDVTPAAARSRFDDLCTDLRDSGESSVSIGISELRDGDSAAQFIGRADRDLLAACST